MSQHNEYSPNLILADSYGLYQKAREELHALELMNAETTLQVDALEKTLQAKGRIAKAAAVLYEHSESTEDFMRTLEETLLSAPGFAEEAHRMGIDDATLSAYLLPLSLLHEDIPSPIESIHATAKNLEIVRDFVRPVEGIATGMLMSGTNAWGAFYAVKGGTPDALKSEGVPQLSYAEISDIDLLVSADSIAELGRCVDSYVTAGLVEPRERDRFAAYKELYEKGEADIFSLRAYYRETEESIHFVSTVVIGEICSLTSSRTHVDSNGLRYGIVRDFRPNIPGNVTRHGAYPLTDIRGLHETAFHPTLTEITAQDGASLGYLSENTVGGPAIVDGKGTYYMGVLASFMAIDPVFLVDVDGRMSMMSAMLHNNVAKILNGAEVRFIPRQERMASHSLAKIKRILEHGNDRLSTIA